MKVLIATGGTGGHINPAIDLANALKKDDPNNEIVFFGSNDRLESKEIPEAGYPFYGYAFVVPEGSFFQKVRSYFSILKAREYCRDILDKEKVDVVVGFGNYITLPMVNAAKKRHIPIVLHEANSYAGKANLKLAKDADVVIGCYPSNQEQFPNNFQLLGNPSATAANQTTFNPKDLTDMGLDPNQPFILIMMGSLGSKSVSTIVDEACALFDDTYQVIIVTGRFNDYQYNYPGNDRIKIVDYVNGKSLLNDCALAVVRAGATTMAEITAIGVPCVVIPSPYVANNHQYYNAKELSDNDACVLIEEKDLTPELLSTTINDLMKNEHRRNELKENAKALGKPNAAYDIVACLKGILKNG